MNGLSRLRYLEEQKLNNELKKIGKAERYYKNYSFFNSLSVMFFIMSFVIIAVEVVYKFLFINTNDLLISLVLLLFVSISIISLCISIFYNSKSIALVKEYYEG
ncbi:MAG: hypothetical protein E7170_01725 [Firmicutes bacterium]|nr:hypothetical protein [Bacillota bacterium]